MAVAAAGGNPLAPFVVGEEGGGDEEDGEDAEEDLHGVFRIAWVGVLWGGEICGFPRISDK